MYLIVDNHDSFTYNLANLVAETGRQVEVRPCDTITVDEITSMKPTGIIISPGPKGPADAKESLDIVREFKIRCLFSASAWACKSWLIRRGFRGTRRKAMHGKITAIHHEGTGLFKGLPTTFDVTRYHSLVVQKSTLPPVYHVDAISDDGAVMAMSHQLLPLFGLQFHPEALLSEYGSELIQAFCRRAEEGGHPHA